MEKWQLGFSAESRENYEALRGLSEASAAGPYTLKEVRQALLVDVAEQLTALWDRSKLRPNERHQLTLTVVLTPASFAYPGEKHDVSKN